jgi:hypothetical protein
MSNQGSITFILLNLFVTLDYIFINRYQPTKFRKNDERSD